MYDSGGSSDRVMLGCGEDGIEARGLHAWKKHMGSGGNCGTLFQIGEENPG